MKGGCSWRDFTIFIVILLGYHSIGTAWKSWVRSFDSGFSLFRQPKTDKQGKHWGKHVDLPIYHKYRLCLCTWRKSDSIIKIYIYTSCKKMLDSLTTYIVVIEMWAIMIKTKFMKTFSLKLLIIFKEGECPTYFLIVLIVKWYDS